MSPDRSRRASIPTVPRLDMFIDVPGGRLKIAAAGDGPPIVLVHSAVVDMRSWDAVTFPDVAHMVGMEAPDRLVGLIVELLAPLPGWR